MPTTEPTQTAPTQMVPAGTLCKSCGYELTGLSRDGVCPECAHPILHSLRPDLLRFHDQRWLASVESGVRGIARGVTIVTWGAIAVIAFVPIILVLAAAGVLHTRAGTGVIGVGAMCVGALLVAGPLMLAAGSVLAGSTRSGAGSPVPLRTWPPTLVRWGGPCFVLAVLANPALEALAPTWIRSAQLLVKGACQVCALGYLWALVARLEDLESRTIDWTDERAKKYRSHRRDLVVAGALYVIFGWLVVGPGPRSPGNWGGSFAVIILLFFYNTTKAAAASLSVELGRAREMASRRASGASLG
jgi:hypothetical protein